jgi:hypothetical protein
MTTRDHTWAAMVDVTQRLDGRDPETMLVIRAARRRSLLRRSVTEGLEAVDKWTDLFEPVRRRRMFGRVWRELQPVQQAASHVGSFLRERPDLA